MYVKVKQIEIMMKVSWCIPTVNIKHFIDHFIKILPASDENEKCAGTEYSRFGSPSNKSEFSTVNVQIKSNLANQLPSQLLKEVNKEIEECVNSIGNLSPLLDDFSCCNLSEMGIAIVCVTISFSFKCLAAKANQNDLKKLLKLKSVYVDWIQKTIERYNLGRELVYDYNRKIKEFLTKVNEG